MERELIVIIQVLIKPIVFLPQAKVKIQGERVFSLSFSFVLLFSFLFFSLLSAVGAVLLMNGFYRSSLTIFSFKAG